jgi:hypothetical protein
MREGKRPSTAEVDRRRMQSTAALLSSFHDPLLWAMAVVALELGATMFAARQHVDPKLLKQARAGKLTKRNTEPGTAERRAVDRATYERRQRRGESGLTARQRAGHPRPTDRLPLISIFTTDPVTGGPAFLVVEVTRREARRAGAYEALVGKLDRGQITPAEFRRRVGHYKSVAGHTLLADPGAVIALLDTLRTEDRELFFYESGRS